MKIQNQNLKHYLNYRRALIANALSMLKSLADRDLEFCSALSVIYGNVPKNWKESIARAEVNRCHLCDSSDFTKDGGSEISVHLSVEKKPNRYYSTSVQIPLSALASATAFRQYRKRVVDRAKEKIVKEIERQKVYVRNNTDALNDKIKKASGLGFVFKKPKAK